MINRKTTRVVLLLALCVPSLALAGSGMQVKRAWVRMVPPVSENTAGYFRLCNHSDKDPELVGASSPIAKVVELHTVVEKDGAYTMKPVSSVSVAAGSCTVFKPGANHLMFIGLVKPLEKGTRVPVQLKMKSGLTHATEFLIRNGGSGGSGHHHHHH